MSEIDEWVPPLPSRHDELLRSLPPRESDSWASRALRTLLQTVREDSQGVLIFPIAVTDAWVENDDTFCVVYTPPFGPERVGHRRQRGDTRPDPCATKCPKAPAYPDEYDPAVGLATPDDPEEFAWLVGDDIGDSLGLFGDHLRYDQDGLGWWGTLSDSLPTGPSR